MRLVHTTSLELSDFTLAKPPPYAILSHTWGPEEVTFQDLCASAAPDRTSWTKAGYAKIVQTCRLAKERGLDYAWIDTCCIDKKSSAELTESINSMFAYYKNAEICIVHLEDLPTGSNDLAPCKWFTRGWTLQELLAPMHHAFYDQTWAFIGTKSTHIEAIGRITLIPQGVLYKTTQIRDFSIATRMSWASDRKTTRPEDVAYCLLGIFEVNMPLIYGEGSRAFRRLQEEIIKRDNDLSILAWEPDSSQETRSDDAHGTNLLAQSPADFSRSRGVHPFANDFPELAITNRGFSISPDIPILSGNMPSLWTWQSGVIWNSDMPSPNVSGTPKTGLFSAQMPSVTHSSPT
ncbi:heterokaryon incompatibility protein-domain-containing protein [Plectosphaerella plurivora]|uniref:Heterokaryon incompatibility protein-domain-containing protein n=1 Tax=Plectosphaerella plurivora TaxID=936078 RepID=A0A9P8VA67_9PEZI|nr:heterokaryon incompatibility protein-domain-containing protein [Plectosphaerella plurivora]